MTTARARERLRQERETFEQAKRHDARWFRLRLVMGYATIALLITVALSAGYIVLQPGNYPHWVTNCAAATFFVDLLSLVATIFKLVLPQNSARTLRPVTEMRSGDH